MSTEENKAVFRRFIEQVWHKRNLDAIAGFYGADFVDHVSLPGLPGGVEGVTQRHAMLFAAFPDIHVTLEDMIAEGDTVVTRYTVRGTNTGPLFGMPPTGKQATISGIDVSRLVGGKFVEHWEQFDQLGLMQQLGVIPTPGQAAV
jgi:steroid delta-isomerase-like uncharacterized protein